MQLVEQDIASPHFTFQPVGVAGVLSPAEVPANAGTTETNLSEMRIDDLREAIRKNEVTFPSQVPTFPKRDRPDMQRNLVQLYFVLGWSSPKIGSRYGLSRLRVQQILNTWKRRAVELGYVQIVPPAEAFLRSPKGPPIRVVLSPVLNGSSIVDIQLSVPSPSRSQRWTKQRVHSRTQSGYRPRTNFSISEIAGVLRQLQAGRTLAEMAHAVGVPAYTIRLWKEQHEMRLLQRENAELKKLLTDLGLGKNPLINSIRKSYGVSA